MYSMQRFATITGVTTKALRHYERVGLLAPARTGGGYRQYSYADMQRLERVLGLRALGFSLKDVAAAMTPTRRRAPTSCDSSATAWKIGGRAPALSKSSVWRQPMKETTRPSSVRWARSPAPLADAT